MLSIATKTDQSLYLHAMIADVVHSYSYRLANIHERKHRENIPKHNYEMENRKLNLQDHMPEF